MAARRIIVAWSLDVVEPHPVLPASAAAINAADVWELALAGRAGVRAGDARAPGRGQRYVAPLLSEVMIDVSGRDLIWSYARQIVPFLASPPTFCPDALPLYEQLTLVQHLKQGSYWQMTRSLSRKHQLECRSNSS